MPARKRKRSALTPIVTTSNTLRRNEEDSYHATSVKTPQSSTANTHPIGCGCIACDILSLSAPPKKRRRTNKSNESINDKKKGSNFEDKENLNELNETNRENTEDSSHSITEESKRKKRTKAKMNKQSKTVRMPKTKKSAHRKRIKAKKARRHSIGTEVVNPEKKSIIHRKLKKYLKWIRDEVEMEEFIDSVERNKDVVEHGITVKDIELIVKDLHKEGAVLLEYGIIYKMEVDDMALFDPKLSVKLDWI